MFQMLKLPLNLYCKPGAENAVDGDIATWWQSPPLSRSFKLMKPKLCSKPPCAPNDVVLMSSKPRSKNN